MLGVTLDPPHDCRHLLATLGLEAFDQVGASFRVQGGVVTVTAIPDSAARRVDEFLEPSDRITRRQLRNSVVAEPEKYSAFTLERDPDIVDDRLYRT